MENNRILKFDGEQNVTVDTKVKYKQIKTDEKKMTLLLLQSKWAQPVLNTLNLIFLHKTLGQNYN